MLAWQSNTQESKERKRESERDGGSGEKRDRKYKDKVEKRERERESEKVREREGNRLFDDLLYTFQEKTSQTSDPHLRAPGPLRALPRATLSTSSALGLALRPRGWAQDWSGSVFVVFVVVFLK